MKFLKITDCSDPHMWYANKVGKYVPFLREYEDCYLSREDEGFSNIVKLNEAKLVQCCTGNCNQGRDCPLRQL